MTDRRDKNLTRRITRMALLTAIALTIFMAEAQLPNPIPIPGIKLGLANIVTVYAIFGLGPADTLMILLARVFLGSVFSGQMMTFFYSLSGGLLCYAAMLFLRHVLTRQQIWACSAIGGACHNIGQLIAAIGGLCILADSGRSCRRAVYRPVHPVSFGPAEPGKITLCPLVTLLAVFAILFHTICNRFLLRFVS